MFGFLEPAEDARERDLEQALIADIQKLLLELGSGFAFHGRQKAAAGRRPRVLSGPPLLPPRAAAGFVVIELKIGKFEPEFVSKMNFYLNAVDEQLRRGDDRESVGIILCADVTRLSPSWRCTADVCPPIAVSTLEGPTRPDQSCPPSRSQRTCRPTSVSFPSLTRSARG